MLVLLASHWIRMLGATLVTLAGFSWLFVLPLNISGRVSDPYIWTARLHRDSDCLLRRPGIDPNQNRAGQTQGYREPG